MADLYNILTPIKREAEKEINQKLSGLLGFVATSVYNSYMPVNVNIQADDQNCILSFKTGGIVQLKRGAYPRPDVTIQSNCETLNTLFTSKNKYLFNQAESTKQIILTPHTQKGQTALNQIRNMFG